MDRSPSEGLRRREVLIEVVEVRDLPVLDAERHRGGFVDRRFRLARADRIGLDDAVEQRQIDDGLERGTELAERVGEQRGSNSFAAETCEALHHWRHDGVRPWCENDVDLVAVQRQTDFICPRREQVLDLGNTELATFSAVPGVLPRVPRADDDSEHLLERCVVATR